MSFTAAHFRSRSLNIVSLSDMIEGSYRSWDLYTTGQLLDGLQKNKRKLVSIKWNHVVFSSVRILWFHPVTWYNNIVTIDLLILKTGKLVMVYFMSVHGGIVSIVYFYQHFDVFI